jgi:methionyl-tRNA synthetase
MPRAARNLWKQMGSAGDPTSGDLTRFRWGALEPGQPIARGEGLFPRVDKKAYLARLGGEQPPASVPGAGLPPIKEKNVENEGTAAPDTPIDIEEFRKVHLRVGRVTAAERVEGARKLLRLQVDMGTEVRQIIAGIAEKYAPETLVGKQIVVVTNLKPATIRGVESRGMLLAAEDASGQATIVTFEEPVQPGAKVR